MPKTLYVSNSDLTREKRFTFTTEDVVATGTTLRMQSVAGFESVSTSSGQIVCIGELGNERTELRRTTNTSGYVPSPTYNEITLIDPLLFDHPQDTKVTIVDWNRADIQWASTSTGAKSTIIASPSYPIKLRPDQNETLFVDTTQTTGYYFVRFNETVGNTNSDWSDPIPFSGYDDNSVAMIKKRALDSLGEEVDGKIITHEFLNQSLWEARREFHNAPGKRPFRRKFNVDIGDALTGSARIELPTDVESPYTAENIFNIRIGTNADMQYYDKKEWDFDFINKPHSTATYPYTANLSTSIWLANGRDFSDSAVISIEGQNIGITRVSSYTGSDFYNSFRIYSHPTSAYNTVAGSDVWQNPTYGLPDKFTVIADVGGSAYINFNRVIDTAYIGQNIYADYYRTLVGFDSDADIIDEPDWDMFTYYLMAKIKHRKDRGNSDITQDPNYKLWIFKKANALANEYLGARLVLFPDISHLVIPQ